MRGDCLASCTCSQGIACNPTLDTMTLRDDYLACGTFVRVSRVVLRWRGQDDLEG